MQPRATYASDLNPSSQAWEGSFIEDYASTYSYDPNGNIQSLRRNQHNQAPPEMDDLTYRYRPGTNQLDFVEDAVSASAAANDIDNQSAGNYEYDPIGNLVKDSAEGISSIIWLANNKIGRITKTNGMVIQFTYDAQGQRITKKVEKMVAGVLTSEIEFYLRDASGNVMANYLLHPDSCALYLTEQPIYGSSRLGVYAPNTDVTTNATSNRYTLIRGIRKYELSNWLGNVQVVISDKKIPICNNSQTPAYYEADVLSAKDYYPFGMTMTQRGFDGGSYKYGYNGQEIERDLNKDISTALFWEYDTRLVMRWNQDPVIKYHESPYAILGNNPIWFIDLNGADTSFSNNETRKLVLDLVNPESKNYNKDFASHFQSLLDDKKSVFNFNKWDGARKDGSRKVFGELSAKGRNEDGQNLINIGFTLESSSQGHTLGALFEETDHAFQFQQGRLGFFDLGGGTWITGDSYDLNDEVDNKIWTANAFNSFGNNTTYKQPLYGLNSKIVNGASRDYVTRIVGIHYGDLNKNNVDVFQAIQIMTSGAVSEDAARKVHISRGGYYSNILIGTPRE